jgi:hypothetical protein
MGDISIPGIPTQNLWISIALICLAYLSFGIALYLRLNDKRGAVLFATYGLILALWATAIPASGSVSAQDVISLLRILR